VPGTRRLSTRILRLQLAILVATLLVGFGLSLWLVRGLLVRQFEERALAVAQAVASEPGIASEIAAHDRSGIVEQKAEAVRKSTGALFVVITDDHGIRYSHPNPTRIGQEVSTDPDQALAGNTVTAVERGTLGLSARAKIPLRTPDGRIVGEVSVGISTQEIDSRLFALIPSVALYSALALLLGVGASLIFARRLKRQTFGLELGEIAELLQEREALLYGIREGVIAVNPDGRVTLINDEARRLLGLRTSGLDADLTDLVPAGRLRDVLSGAIGGRDQVILTQDHCLVVNRMPVSIGGQGLGAVVTLSDRTEQESLLRELDSVRGLTDAVRAQQHEFGNRVHALSGLLELGRYEEATSYAQELSGAETGVIRQVQERIGNPQLVGLLVAKSVLATERGVEFRLVDESALDADGANTRALLTIIGNLVDNAIDAAADGAAPALVEVGIMQYDDRVHLQVRDSGAGVPAEAREAIFADGYSTKARDERRRRGLGLALVQRMINQHRGHITVSEGPGAIFSVDLPTARERGRVSVTT
jgi:two-component system CitB family sensor kinase